MVNIEPNETDEEIAQKVQKGHKEDFGRLVVKFENKLLRYAAKFLYNYEDRQDLIQNVFIKAFINLQSFDSKRSFSAWIYRIAHNEFINAIKKKGQEALPFWNTDTLFPHPVSRENPEGDLQRKQDKELIDDALEKLNVKYREPLVLFYFEELDYAQISEILEIPKATVGVRLKRGREQLKLIHGRLENNEPQ